MKVLIWRFHLLGYRIIKDYVASGMGAFHQRNFWICNFDYFSIVEHVTWRNNTLSFWYVFSPSLLAVVFLTVVCNEVLCHVTFKNDTILFLYVYLLSLMIIPLWKLWCNIFNLLLDHLMWSKVTSPVNLVPFHRFHQLWFANDFWIFHMII